MVLMGTDTNKDDGRGMSPAAVGSVVIRARDSSAIKHEPIGPQHGQVSRTASFEQRWSIFSDLYWSLHVHLSVAVGQSARYFDRVVAIFTSQTMW